VPRQLTALERATARIEAQRRGLGGSGIGTGELIWLVRGPIASPFGQRGGAFTRASTSAWAPLIRRARSPRRAGG
jgi:hypothetical protein